MTGTVKEEALKLRQNLDKVYEAGQKEGHKLGIADMCEEATYTNKTVKIDCPGGFPMTVTSAIEGTQEGSGDPHPGSLLAIYDDGWKDTTNWIEVYCDDHYEFRYEFETELPVGTYTLFYKWIGNNTAPDYGMFKLESKTSSGIWTNVVYDNIPMHPDPPAVTRTFDVADASKIVRIIIDSMSTRLSDVNIQDLLGALAIYSGTEAQEANVRPIVGYDHITLNHYNKNLLPDTWKDWSNWTDQRYFLNLAPGTYVITATKTDDPAYLYLHKSVDGGTTWELAGSSKGYILANASINSVSFTVSVGEKWGLWTGVNHFKAVKTIQIEAGSVATPYEPHNTYTVDLGQTVYSGSYNWSTGELTAEWVVMSFNGSEPWRLYNSSSTICSCFQLTIADKAIGYGTSICNMSTNRKNNHGFDANYMQPGLYSDHPTLTNVYFPWGEPSTDVATFKAWLKAQYDAGTPVQLCYKLATTRVIKLAPQTLMSLPGTNVLESESGNTTVTTLVTGKQVEYDSFWDTYKPDGGNINYLFAGNGWCDDNFNPSKIPTTVSHAYMTFSGSRITDLSMLPEINIDGSGNCQYMFYNATYMKHIGKLNVKMYEMYGTFNGATALETIDRLTVHENTKFTSTFNGCTNLKNITFDGVIGKSIDFRHSPLLTEDSLVSILSHLKNYSGTTDEYVNTLTLNYESYMKLHSIYVRDFVGPDYEGPENANDYISYMGWNLSEIWVGI